MTKRSYITILACMTVVILALGVTASAIAAKPGDHKSNSQSGQDDNSNKPTNGNKDKHKHKEKNKEKNKDDNPSSVNQTETVVVDFEDEPMPAQLVVCDYPVLAYDTTGKPLPEPTECDPAEHEWVKSKGIDLAATGGRGIAITQVAGSYSSGIVIQSPPLIDGLPEFKFTVLNRTSSFFEIEALTDPSIDDYNNLLASVRMNAFDSNGNEIASKTFTFSTITNGDYTPGRLRIEIPDLKISTVTVDVLSLPTEYSGFWIEAITFNRVPIEQATDSTPPAITVPLPDDVPTNYGIFDTGYGTIEYMDPLWIRAYDAVDGVVPVICTPPSGSLFPIGKDVVTCEAKDSAGNNSVRSFFVAVVQCKEVPGGIECP